MPHIVHSTIGSVHQEQGNKITVTRIQFEYFTSKTLNIKLRSLDFDDGTKQESEDEDYEL